MSYDLYYRMKGEQIQIKFFMVKENAISAYYKIANQELNEYAKLVDHNHSFHDEIILEKGKINE